MNLKRLGWLFVGASLGLLLIQPVVRWGANYYLTNKARLPVHVGSLFINPVTSRVSVGLQGAKPGQVLLVDLGAIRFDWWTLLLKRLRVGHIRLENARFLIKRDAEGRLFVGDIELPGDPGPQKSDPPPPEEQSDWGVGIGRVNISTVAVDYQDPTLNVRFAIRRFVMEPAESWRPNRDSRFEADLLLQERPLRITGSIRPFANPIEAKGRLELDALPIDWLSAVVFSSGTAMLGGHLTVGMDFAIRADTEDQTSRIETTGRILASSVTVSGKTLPMTETRFSGPIEWKGVKLDLFSSAVTHAEFEKITGGPGARVDLKDTSARPVFQYSLAGMTLNVGPGELFDAAPRIPFDFTTRSTAGGGISFKGRLAPLATPPDGELNLAIDKLNLAAFSPLMEKKTAYRIASGRYTMATDATIHRGQLDSKTSLDAETFYVNKLRAEEREENMESIGFPLGLGLALLRDAEDHIRLDVPVQGELNDPKVPVGQLVWVFIKKALASAVRNAAAAFFPGGGAVGFQPVVFEPGSSTLSPEAQDYLKQLGESMAKRPQVKISLTGVAAPQDASKRMLENISAFDWDAVKPADRSRLRALAEARAQVLQDFLVQNAGVHVDRLVKAAPIEDSAPTGAARVDISF